MDITVIICTYNRSYLLKNVLKSLSEQVVPESLKWEIIVVDNNSTDDTFKVVEDFDRSSSIPIKYVKEEKQGLSHARNRGIVESSGKYVAFTDDDAIADRNWVSALYETFQKYGCDCVGGRIYLKCNSSKPEWLTKDLWGFIGFLDHGDEVEVIDVTKKFLFGGNIALRKLIFDRVGYFSTGLGRKGSKLFGSEELELLTRMAEYDIKAVYQPKALVYHVIGHERLRKKYFRILHYKAGEQEAYLNSSQYERSIFAIPLFIIPQFFRSIFRYFKRPTLRMQMNIWWFLGFIKGRIRYKSRRIGSR
jgi:glycosyltransferase involved in cell wall biosynthesis